MGPQISRGTCQVPAPSAGLAILPHPSEQEQWTTNSLYTICDSKSQYLPSESHSFMARVPVQLPLVLGPVSLLSPPLHSPTYASLSFRLGSRPLGTPTAEHRVHSETPAVCSPPGLVAHCNMSQDTSESSPFTRHIFPEHPWVSGPIWRARQNQQDRDL